MVLLGVVRLVLLGVVRGVLLGVVPDVPDEYGHNADVFRMFG